MNKSHIKELLKCSKNDGIVEIKALLQNKRWISIHQTHQFRTINRVHECTSTENTLWSQIQEASQ